MNLDISSISSFNDLGIDIFNIKDSFFNDLCNSYSSFDNDIILEDRIKYIFKNYSLCENGCEYNNFNIESMLITCECKVKENISTFIYPLKFEQPKESSIMDSNIGVIKCYNLVFSFNGKLSNIGFWIFLILIIVNIIFLFLYFSNGIKSIIIYLFNEMVKNGYLNKKDKLFFENKNNLAKINNKGKDKTKLHLKRNKAISNPIKNTNNNKNKKSNSKIKNIKNSGSVKLRFNKKVNIQNSTDSSINKLKKRNNNILKEKIKTIKNSNINKYKNKKNKKSYNLTTENINKGKEHKENNKNNNFSIIKININHIENYTPQDSYQSLHNYTFEEAIKYDKRSICKIFYIYLLSKQIVFHTFLQHSPLELFPLRFCLFIFMLSIDLALNSLFYLNDNISKKYLYTKNLFLFTFSNNITIIILSTVTSFIGISLISKLCNSTNEIRNVFNNEEEKLKKNKKYKINEKRKKEIYIKIEKILKCFKIKIAFFIIFEMILILFFWYFVTAFCHVFSNTQTSWLLDSFLSLLSKFVIELLFALLFAKLYILSVESNTYCLYRILLFIYDFT